MRSAALLHPDRHAAAVLLRLLHGLLGSHRAGAAAHHGLLGLHRLGGGNGRISPLPPAGREENALARCIREELRFIQACAGQTGQWMPVLEALGTLSRENLLLLLEILGDK